jgi:hypothetical protein
VRECQSESKSEGESESESARVRVKARARARGLGRGRGRRDFICVNWGYASYRQKWFQWWNYLFLKNLSSSRDGMEWL